MAGGAAARQLNGATSASNQDDAKARFDAAAAEVLDSAASLEQRRAALARAQSAAASQPELDNHLASLELDWVYALSGLAASGTELAREAEDFARACAARRVGTARVALQLFVTQSATKRGAFGEALNFAAQAQATAEALTADEGRDYLLVYCAVAHAQLELDLGLVELAFERLSAVARAVSLENLEVAAMLSHRITFANAALAAAQYERLLGVIDEGCLARAAASNAGTHAQLQVQRGLAQAEMQRDKGEKEGPAAATLRAALASNALTPDHAALARLMLADLALSAASWDAAARELEQVDASALAVERRTRKAALGAALSLGRGAAREELLERRAELERELEASLEQWRSLERRPGGVGFWHFGSQRQPYSEWIRLCLALDDSQAGLERALTPLLAAQSVGTLARALEASAEVAQVRTELCSEGRGVLWLLPALDRSHVFTLDERGIEHHEAPMGDELARAAAALAEHWATPPPSDDAASERRRAEFARRSTDLAQVLLSPSQRSRVLSWSACLVIGADIAGDLPLQCLALDGAQPLGLLVPVLEAPSVPVALALSRRARERDLAGDVDLALIADPRIDPQAAARYPKAGELNLSAPERERLAADFDPARVRWFERERANLAALEHPDVRGAKVLAILSHGVFDTARRSDGERPSALVLSSRGAGDDGVVWCADVEQRAAPRLVELLACGAARGPLRIGDDAAGHLVGAFFLAGADTVLAARVDIERDAATNFAEEFHRALRRSGVPAQALLEARRALARQAEFADPWFWAGLSLYGAGTTPVLEPAPARQATSAATRIGIAALVGSIGVAALVLLLRTRAARSNRTAQ